LEQTRTSPGFDSACWTASLARHDRPYATPALNDTHRVTGKLVDNSVDRHEEMFRREYLRYNQI